MRTRGETLMRVVALLVVVGPYAASFFLPALVIPVLDQPAMDRLKTEVASRAGGEVVSVEGPSGFVVKGYQAFRGGPSGGWALAAAWFANPVLWAGCLLLVARRWKGAALAGGVAVALGSAMILAAVVGNPRADVRWSVADYRVGYWLWLGSMALLVPAGLIGRRSGQRLTPSEDRPNDPLQQPAGA